MNESAFREHTNVITAEIVTVYFIRKCYQKMLHRLTLSSCTFYVLIKRIRHAMIFVQKYFSESEWHVTVDYTEEHGLCCINFKS